MGYREILLKAYNEFKILYSPSVALVIGIFTLILQKNSNRYVVARERVEYVYHPLFTAIEPYLYKNVMPKDVKPFLDKFKELDAKYSLLIYPSLRQHIGFFINQSSPADPLALEDSEWFLICDYVCKDYDKLCRIAHLPVRSIAYRLNKKQFKTKLDLCIALLRFFLPHIVFITLFSALAFPALLPIAYLLLFAVLAHYFVNGA